MRAMVKYVIINKKPIKVEDISIPSKGIEECSPFNFFNQFWIKDGHLLVPTSELDVKESKELAKYPDAFVHKYIDLKPHMMDISSHFEVVLPGRSPSNYALNYCNDNGIDPKSFSDPLAYRFQFDLIINDQSVSQYSSWYSTCDEAFSYLVDLVDAINGRGPSVVEI